MLLYCLRERQGEVKHSQRVLIGVEREDKSRIEIIRDRIDTLVDLPMDNAIIDHQRYVDLLPMVRDQRLVFLKSALGTGKTEAVHRLIKEKGYQKILYISFRKTFTQSLAARFADIGNVL